MKEKIAIIGAGVGGLSLAARLGSRGYRVEIFEKLNRPGGRNNIIEKGGFKFDTGPSFILMPGLFEELFSYCGKKLEDYLEFIPLDISYKIFYPDGDSFTVCRDTEKTKQDLEKIERGSASGFERMLRDTGAIYKEILPFLYSSFTPVDLLRMRHWGLIKRIKPFCSYWDLARRYFKSEKLISAFTFEAMFIGVSPFDAPAFYSIITYADHAQKIYHPKGGMYQIPLALERLSREYGAEFHYGSQVQGIKQTEGRVALELEGRDLEFDKVAINADYAYAKKSLLKRRLKPYFYSCSVSLVYLGLKKKLKGLCHHNLFFSKDLKLNLKQIFHDKVMPQDPSFYVHVPTVTDASLAPEGKEIVYILIPVANLERPRKDLAAEEEALRQKALDRISEEIGERIEPLIEVEERFSPQDFITRYNIEYAATFGLSHTLSQSAFFRPPNFDSCIKGLYFVGASTQPGGGLPVVIAGSRITSELIEKHSK